MSLCADHPRVGATHDVAAPQTLTVTLTPSSVQQDLPGHGSAGGCFPISRAFCKMQSQKQGVRSHKVRRSLHAHGGDVVLAAVAQLLTPGTPEQNDVHVHVFSTQCRRLTGHTTPAVRVLMHTQGG